MWASGLCTSSLSFLPVTQWWPWEVTHESPLWTPHFLPDRVLTPQRAFCCSVLAHPSPTMFQLSTFLCILPAFQVLHMSHWNKPLVLKHEDCSWLWFWICCCLFSEYTALWTKKFSFVHQDPCWQLPAPSLVVPLNLVCIIGLHCRWK